MAKSKAVSAKVEKPAGTAIATIDQELDQEVQSIKERLGQSGGSKISIEPKGEFVMPDGLEMGPTIKVVILDYVIHHQWFEKAYVQGQFDAPRCFAYGKKLETMAPDERAADRQAETCAACWANAFGTGQNGKSKACKQSRDLAVLVIDDENPEAHLDPDAPIHMLSISASNIKGFDATMSKCLSLLGHPLKAIFEITATNAGTYATLSYRTTGNPNYKACAARRAEVEATLIRIPDYQALEAKAQQRPQQQRRPQGNTPRSPAVAAKRR